MLPDLIQNMLETERLARHAIRKAIEATRDYAKASGVDLIEDRSLGLQSFTINMQERAERGYDRL